MTSIFTYTKISKIKLHLFIWFCFIVTEVLAARSMAKEFRPFINYVFFYSLNIILFYVNAHFVLPFALGNRAKVTWQAPVALFIECLVYVSICFLGLGLLDTMTIQQVGKTFAFWPFWRCIFFLIFSTGYYYLKAYLKSRLAEEAAEKRVLQQILNEQEILIELTKAKYAYLQARINPHFLFNALNFIFTRSRRSDLELSRAIMLLSNIMRFSVDCEQREEQIPIAEEIEQVKGLIEFSQIKDQEPIFIDVNCSADASDTSFIPLILLTLTENMIKHGELHSSDHPGRMDILFEGRQLIIETNNFIGNQHGVFGFSTGLDNIRQRLIYAFGDFANFEFGKLEGDIFRVRIRVDLPAISA